MQAPFVDPWTLPALGVRPAEQNALRQYLVDIDRLLAMENSALPSREHPFIARVLVSFSSTDPVDELDHRLTADPQVLTSLRKRLGRTHARLHSAAPLSSSQCTDLAVSLVLTRVFISWRLGLLDHSGKEESVRQAAAGQDTLRRSAAHMWLWCGLLLARLCGQGEEDDLDFGI